MYLVRYSEIALKSEPVRREWEKRLVENIRSSLDLQDVRRERGRIWIEDEDCDPEKLSKIFGIQSFSHCEDCKIEDLEEFLLSYAEEKLKEKKSFGLKVKRVGSHDFTSQDIAKEMGKKILEKMPHLKVDLEDDKGRIFIEIREKNCYIFDEIISGVGGLPLGASGRLVSLFSGDIYSAGSSWMMMKRGCEIVPVHFSKTHLKDKTELERAEKNIEVLRKFSPDLDLIIVDHSEFLKETREELEKRCMDDHLCIFCKRRMYEVAEKIALESGAKGIVTGENLVCDRSKTFDNLTILEQSLKIPIYRPLVGLDKGEIEDISRSIGFKGEVKNECSIAPSSPVAKANLDAL
ncbi:MAG: THUMP domain-containing protein [Halobacteriota archaeon]|nr:THUMP domain-containing protein [Halobacteriota archaeon]